MENPVKMDDLGVPSEPKIFPNICGDFNGDEYHGIESVQHHKKKQIQARLLHRTKYMGVPTFHLVFQESLKGSLSYYQPKLHALFFGEISQNYDKF